MTPEAPPEESSSLGKLFTPSEKAGLVVRVRIEGDRLLAEQHRPVGDTPPLLVSYPLRTCGVAFAGDGHSKITLTQAGSSEAGGEDVLYLDRSVFEPRLRALGLAAVDRVLGAETARVQKRHGVGLAAWAAFLAACLGGLFGLSVAADLVAARAVHWIPVSWEAKVGSGLYEAASTQWEEVDDPVVTEPVRALFDRLVTASESEGFAFQITVAKDETSNAFAMPGGGIVVLTGLLTKATRPEEIAGVLAHEIQHVRHRHSLQTILQHLKWRALLSLVVGDLQSLSELLLARATGLVALAHSRESESEADIHAVALLVKAGIDPTGLRDFFARLAEEGDALSGVLSVASTHPASEARVQYLDKLIDSVGDRSYESVPGDWAALRRALGEGAEGTASEGVADEGEDK